MSALEIGRLLGLSKKDGLVPLPSHPRKPARDEAGPAWRRRQRPLKPMKPISAAKRRTSTARSARREAHRRRRQRDRRSACRARRRVRSQHVATVNAETLKPGPESQHSTSKSYLMTDDEGHVYVLVGQDFSSHGMVNHAIDEYVRGDFCTRTPLRAISRILKRGIYRHVSTMSARSI